MDWETVIKIAVAVVPVVIAWAANEFSKRRSEEYLRREANYRALVLALKGFYVGGSEEDKAAFLEQLNLGWLYCPDDVIRKAYSFLDTVHTDAGINDDGAKERALGDFVAAVREDLISREPVRETGLTGRDYRLLTVNRR